MKKAICLFMFLALIIAVPALSCVPTYDVTAPSSGYVNEPAQFCIVPTNRDCSQGMGYIWDFGDGSSHSGLRCPEHTYSVAGTYTWSITATLDDQVYSNSGSIVIAEPPCSVSCNGSALPSFGAAPLSVNFSGSSTASNCTGGLSYDWDFGDGAAHSAEQNPTHTYSADGTYNWTMTVSSDDQVCVKTGVINVAVPCTLTCDASSELDWSTLVASFSGSADYSCDGSPTFRWDFGDGTPPVYEQSPTHGYDLFDTYTWTLEVTVGLRHCIKTGTIDTNPCYISCQPSANPDSGMVPLTVSFTSNVTTRHCNSSSPTFDWRFGDGSAHSNEENPTHTYTTPGTYDWKIVVSTDGTTDVRYGTVTVLGEPCRLNCDASSSPQSGSEPLAVSFSASATTSNCPGGTILIDWDFGDGSAHSTTPNAVHTYSAAGTYTWTMKAASGDTSCTRMGTINVTSPSTFSISGNVAGEPAGGIKVVLSGASNALAVSDASGHYSFSGLSNGSYTITPSEEGRDFTPESRNVSINYADVEGQDFSEITREVWAWGFNYFGTFGNGNNHDSCIPIRIYDLDGVTSISSSSFHAFAVKKDGTVLSWGNNTYGVLGTGNDDSSDVPVEVLNLENIKAVATGTEHALAVDNDGRVWAWGGNDFGQLGDVTGIYRNEPVLLSELSNVKAVAAGEMHSLALKNDGTVWAWGDNYFGELGDGTNYSSSMPKQIPTLSGIEAIAAGFGCSLAIDGDGRVWAWGYNGIGQLGDGTNENRNVPVEIEGLPQIKAIEIRKATSFALDSTGHLWAWGYNEFGTLGNGTYEPSNVPLQVQGISDVVSFAVGNYVLAIDGSGRIWSWGYNLEGELGNGTNANTNLPAEIAGIDYAVLVEGGGFFSFAITVPCALSCSASVRTLTGAESLSGVFEADASSSHCDGDIQWDWDFGDGSIHSSSQHVVHTYNTGGTYTWTLTVTADGNSCTKSGTISVCSVECFEPNAGTVWSAGGECPEPISWVSSGCGSNMQIGLYKDGNWILDISSDVANNGVYGWYVPADLSVGNAYTVVVRDLSTGAIDESAPFSVVLPPSVHKILGNMKNPNDPSTFELQIKGDGFVDGCEVYIGNDLLPWGSVEWKSGRKIVLSGNGLYQRFADGECTAITVVNPDGGKLCSGYMSTMHKGICKPE